MAMSLQHPSHYEHALILRELRARIVASGALPASYASMARPTAAGTATSSSTSRALSCLSRPSILLNRSTRFRRLKLSSVTHLWRAVL